MPTKILIPVASALRFSPQGKQEYYVAIVPIARLPFDQLPLDANLRRANNKSKVVKSITSTLLEKPEEFLNSNQGIILIAESAHFKYAQSGEPTGIMVEMLSGLHGVANGAHTLAAIHQAHFAQGRIGDIDLSTAFVILRVNVGVTDDALKDAVVNLNTSEKVDRRSILNKAGKLDNVKAGLEELGYSQITFFQNEAASQNRRESTRQNVVHILKLLTLIDKNRYNPEINLHPSSVMGGGSSVLDTKTIDRADDLILDFLPLLIKIENAVCKRVAAKPDKLPGVKPTKDKDKFALMTDGTPIACAIPSSFAFPLISAFRAFIEDDKWQIPVEQDDVLTEIIDTLWRHYSQYLHKEWLKENRNLGGILRNNSVWGYLYNMALKYFNDYLKRLVVQNNEKNGRVPSELTPTQKRR